MCSRRRRLLTVAAALAAALLIAAWLARDLPRRRIEAALAERLGARVRLEVLHLAAVDTVVLEGLTVDEPSALPAVDRVTLGRITARGGLTDMVAGHFELLRLADVDVVLREVAAAPTAAPPATLVARRLELDRARVRLGREGDPIIVTGTLEEVGHDLRGTLHLAASRLEPIRLLGAVGVPIAAPWGTFVVEQLAADVEVHGPDQARVEATAARVLVSRAGRTIGLDDPGLSAQVDLGEGGPSLTASCRLPQSEPILVEASVAEAQEPRLRVVAGGLTLRPWLDLLGLPTLDLEPTADLTVDGNPLAELEYAVTATAEGIELPAGRSNARLAASGTLHLDRNPPAGPVTARLHLDGSGASGSPLLPARALVAGELTLGASPGLAGLVTLATSSLGTLSAEGLLDGSGLAARWQWHGCDLSTVLEGAGLQLPARITARIAASGTVRGPVVAPTIDGTVAVTDLVVWGPARSAGASRRPWSTCTGQPSGNGPPSSWRGRAASSSWHRGRPLGCA